MTSVFLGSDFISVNIKETSDWMIIKPDIFSAIQVIIFAFFLSFHFIHKIYRLLMYYF